jgi:hypothetical protein
MTYSFRRHTSNSNGASNNRDPRAAEMPETVLTPTTREFLQKFAKNSSKWQNFVKKCQEKE